MRHRNWKSFLGLSATIALLVGAPGVALSQASVASTAHNLSASAGAGQANYGQVCVYCHAPHNAVAGGPLWNKNLTASVFTMYNSSNSATMNMVVAGTPGPVSKACLTCHDGTIGLDVIANNPTAVPSLGTRKMTGGALFGTNLTNQHPIAVTYNVAMDAAFNAIVSGKVGVLPLYGPGKDQVECGTCHNVHNNTIDPFLRATNTGSALCLTCHIK